MSSEPAAEVGAAGVREGDVLAGKYRVDRVLGVGGMGVVVAAHHLRLDEKVAIKLLRPEALAAPEAVARFDREARAAVKIKSEHVARVTDVGVLDNGSPYMVMEYLDGSDLSQWLARHGALPVEQTVDFVLQACEAIAEAHALGIVHRDLKPANLYCIRRPDGAMSIKVLDFGISKLTGLSTGMSMTRTQAVMGSPLYMSPEQLESSKGVDARADIWAIGIILFELLTASVPFNSDMITELVIRIVSNATPPVRTMRPDVPPGLEAIIMCCLEKDRDRRFPNVAELAGALVQFGPPSSRLSLERIQGVTHGAGGAMRPSFHSAPPGVATRPMGITPPTMPIQYGVTRSSWGAGHTGGPPLAPAEARRSAAVPILAVVAGLALVAGASGLFLAQRASRAAPAVAPPASAVALGASASAPPSDPVVALTPPPPPVDTSSATPPPSPVPAPAPTVPPSRPVSTGMGRAPAPRPSAAPAKKADCDPPYFVDAAGHRQYKKECF